MGGGGGTYLVAVCRGANWSGRRNVRLRSSTNVLYNFTRRRHQLATRIVCLSYFQLTDFHLVTIVFETYPAPVDLEPPSLCLLISFLFCIGVIKRG